MWLTYSLWLQIDTLSNYVLMHTKQDKRTRKKSICEKYHCVFGCLMTHHRLRKSIGTWNRHVSVFIFIWACQLYVMPKRSALYSVSSDLQRRSVERGFTSNRGNTELMSACQYFITSPGLSFSNHFFYSFFIHCALWGEKLLTKTSEQRFEAGRSSWGSAHPLWPGKLMVIGRHCECVQPRF